jgi:hypothetical protein
LRGSHSAVFDSSYFRLLHAFRQRLKKPQ